MDITSTDTSSSSSTSVLLQHPSLEEPLPAIFPADMLDPTRYDTAPSCLFSPSSSNSLSDSQGRLWGWMKGTSCLFRKPSETAIAAAAAAAGSSGIIWDTAPLCTGVPNGETSLADDSGQLWGWQQGRSCAFRGKAPSVSRMKGQLPIEPMHTLWENAPSCSSDPTIGNTLPDTFGRFWGEENGQACAFKVSLKRFCSKRSGKQVAMLT